jgi:steroid 5-alpha reductase family enzyme
MLRMPAVSWLYDGGVVYARADPLVFAVSVCAAFAAACWLVSVLTGNYSQVDRLWSLAPPLYACHFAARAGFANPRLNLIALLVVLWGTRLTYNFARKGGYRWHGEDYRWPELRQRLGPAWFQLLNATFVAPYQNLLLLLIVLPAYVAWQAGATPLNALDAAAALAFIVFLLGETIADQQQWRFQCEKHARKAAGERIEVEFLTAGLFRYSRHPNFFCEQAMWWTIYVFSIAASGRWLNWSIGGAILLTLLFQGSTQFTEQLTLRKYPAYRAYQRTTSRLIPWVPDRGCEDDRVTAG